MPFATEQFPKFPYAVLLWVHATHPTQVFAFGTHSDQGKPHPDALEKNRQDGPLQSDALGMAARPNLLGTSHRIAPLVFSEDRIVVGIGNRKDPDCDAVNIKTSTATRGCTNNNPGRPPQHSRWYSPDTNRPSAGSVVAEGNQETNGEKNATDQCRGPAAAQNNKDHATYAATDVSGGYDKAPAPTDKGRHTTLVLEDVDPADIPAGDPAGDRVAPFVYKDGHQADRFREQGFPREECQCDV
eukprot:CAMPEP_0201233248 /NCGR_PEP_ID=MMETSP0852-20130820/5101_1 /ASSEMBLY_ACC=CAM_ASM_000632 /TAXON_ID=183588 /ORGANISM="Pseudo-nitzschia fraudulenta, Strain WWA7" /LENGTH=241 /DNA_ID=CAMNT_0047526051 /DNA_START=811 /DNA_END=1533 /DNA_ORIENTATION=+